MTRKKTWTDLWRDYVYNVAADRLHAIRNELANGYAKRCTICDTPNVYFKPSDVEGFVETYSHSNALRGQMVRVGVIVDAPIGQVVEWRAMYSTTGKDSITPPVDIHELEFVEFDRFEVPQVQLMLNTSIHEHHIRYEPEMTIPLCAQCHKKVHASDGWNDELKPEMARTEWES